MRDNLDLDLARTFVTIADTGSFSRAAERLHISVPTVSLQMKRLEEHLRQELFFKDGRSRELTETGRIFLAFARKLLRLNDMVFTEVRRQQFEGRLRIGATEDFAEDRLPELLREFSLGNPEVRIDLMIDVNRKLHAALANGDIDIALVVQDPFAPREGTFLFRENLIWIAADDIRIAPDRPIPLILFDEPCIVRDLALRSLEEANRDYRIVCTSPSLSGIRMAVRAGLGVTVRTRAQIEPGVKEISISSELPTLPEVDLCIFTRDEVFSGNSLLAHMKSVLMDVFSDSRFNRRLTAVRTRA